MGWSSDPVDVKQALAAQTLLLYFWVEIVVSPSVGGRRPFGLQCKRPSIASRRVDFALVVMEDLLEGAYRLKPGLDSP